MVYYISLHNKTNKAFISYESDNKVEGNLHIAMELEPNLFELLKTFKDSYSPMEFNHILNVIYFHLFSKDYLLTKISKKELNFY